MRVADTMSTRQKWDRQHTARVSRHRTGGDVARVVTVVLFAVLQPMSSWLANALPGEQATTGDVSDRYAHLVTPAGYTFAIWGLIYVASLALAVYQALPSQHARDIHRATGWWVAGAFAASTFWVPMFVSGALGVAQVVLIALVVCLAVALGTLTLLGPASTHSERWLLRLPVSGYLGWATIATVAGTGTTAQWAGVSLTNDVVVASSVAGLLVLGILALWIASRILAAAGFAALLVWGLMGVAFGTSEGLVVAAALFAASLPVVEIAVRARRSERPAAVLLG